MNAFQSCQNTSDAVPLYLPQQLYLKPLARLNISLQLPNLMKTGKSISHWEIMEKLRELIKPDEFTVLKVTKTTIEFVRFEGEVEIKKKIERVLNKLDNRMIKLKNYSEFMRVKAAESKFECPTRQTWDAFFQEAKDMNELKPGERPDTVHISNLPSKWFVPYHLSNENDVTPSEKVFFKIFEKFGSIRYVDIPICDPYRCKMKDHISGLRTSSIDNREFFEGYIQFKDYIGFAKCMDALRGMKLLHKDEDESIAVNMKVDFDKTKHLSDANIRRREIVRDRLVKKQREREEKEKDQLEEKKQQEQAERQKEIDVKKQKEQRRKLREEKRKAKILEKLKIKGADEINEKIAKEEKKLLKVQRKLESIRLLEELFRRITEKREKDKGIDYYTAGRPSESNTKIKKFKSSSELEMLNQKEKLHNAIKGRAMLKTVLQGNEKRYSSTSSEESTHLEERNQTDSRSSTNRLSEEMYDPLWYGYSPSIPYHVPSAPLYPPVVRGHAPYFLYQHRGRGHPRMQMQPMPGPSRGSYVPRRFRGYKPRFRGNFHGVKPNYSYPPDMQEEYMRYFSKFLHEHDDRNRRHSRSRSRSRSRRRSRSRSRHSRSRSYSRHRSYSRRSYSRSRSRSRRSPSYRSRSRSKERNKSSSRRSHRSRRSSRRSRSTREKSVGSSKFISPNRMRTVGSESWCSPKEGERENKSRSWSKTPEPEK